MRSVPATKVKIQRYIPVAGNRPKPPHVWLLFLYAGYKRAVLGSTILSNGREHFGWTDRNDQTGQSGYWVLDIVNIGLNGKRPTFVIMYIGQDGGILAKSSLNFRRLLRTTEMRSKLLKTQKEANIQPF